ncbi:MAG: hypothetical protein ACRYFX_09435 [Janthinobacterium lividum]
MVSHTQPQAPTLPAPTGLDAEIQRLQLLLAAGLPWLQVSYGKAYRGSRKHPSTGKLLFYPEVYDGAREYRDVLPNDNVVAQSFFYPTSPAVNPEHEPLLGTLGFTQAVDLIVWANLERVDDTKTYRFENELVVDVLRVLNHDGGARVLRVFTTNEEVFRGFSVELVPEQALRQPFCGFRVQLELSVSNVLC